MIDINKLFGTDKNAASEFYSVEHDLSPDERMKLHHFFEGTYKTTTVAKSFMGISAGLTMVWLARRKRKISPLYAMLGGIGLSAFVFSYMTPTIYANKLRELERRVGKDSKIYKVVEATPEPAEYSYYWSQYFENSVLDRTVRLADPSGSPDGSSAAPAPEHPSPDHLILPNGIDSPESSWDKLRRSRD